MGELSQTANWRVKDRPDLPSDLVIQRGTDKKSAHATRKFPDEEVHINHHRAKNSSPGTPCRLWLAFSSCLWFCVDVISEQRHPPFWKTAAGMATRPRWWYPSMVMVLSVFFGRQLAIASTIFWPRSGRKSRRWRQGTWHWDHHRARRLPRKMAQPSRPFYMIIMRGFSSSLTPYRQIKRAYCHANARFRRWMIAQSCQTPVRMCGTPVVLRLLKCFIST